MAVIQGSKMVVMLLCHADQTNPQGGLERQAFLLATRLIAAGERIQMLGSTRAFGATKDLLRDTVPTRLFWSYASPQVSGRYLPAALIWAVQLLWWLQRNKDEVAVIHCHQMRIHSFVAAIARRWWGIPVIQKSAVGGPGADIRTISSRKYFGRSGKEFVVQWSDVFIATTATIQDDLVSSGVPAEKIRLIPNGLRIPPRGASLPATSHRVRRFVFLGRLDVDKNILALADGAELAFRGTDCELHIYGRGPLAGALQTKLERTNSRCVRYMGFVEDTSAVLAESGFLVLPSSGEGLSNAMIEAMVHGVVPITTRVSGCVDHIVQGLRGFYMDGVDAQGIAQSLQMPATMTESAWLQMSVEVSQYGSAHFSMDTVAAAYASLYRELSTSLPSRLAP